MFHVVFGYKAIWLIFVMSKITLPLSSIFWILIFISSEFQFSSHKLIFENFLLHLKFLFWEQTEFSNSLYFTDKIYWFFNVMKDIFSHKTISKANLLIVIFYYIKVCRIMLRHSLSSDYDDWIVTSIEICL